MRALVLGFALFTATPVMACMNDRRVEADEQEFRSSYADGDIVRIPQEESGGSDILAVGASALGGIMLASAVLLTIRAPRPKS
jgi:hypothetical protein